MTRWVVKLFGILPLLVVERTEYTFVDSEEKTHGGGSAHNFVLAPEYVDERYEPWYEDRQIGFRA